jgi:putative PIN family toxin of toxin-antitoxin system
MKIVLDANTFISSFFWGGNPRLVLQRAISKIDELYITKEILGEIEVVMGRPKFHTEKVDIEYFISSIEEISNKVIPTKRVKNGSRDKTDNKYIECGIAGGVDYIISGDVHLLEMKKYKKIDIVSASEYLEIIK